MQLYLHKITKNRYWGDTRISLKFEESWKPRLRIELFLYGDFPFTFCFDCGYYLWRWNFYIGCKIFNKNIINIIWKSNKQNPDFLHIVSYVLEKNKDDKNRIAAIGILGHSHDDVIQKFNKIKNKWSTKEQILIITNEPTYPKVYKIYKQ
ncbi:MAG: hypothetical protein WCX73_05070 [Candidatus Pacearchaeota archaeon]|jgi:hypothetical protein